MQNIKCVIFDMDGVMFDTERLASQIWLQILDKYHLEPKKEFLDGIKGRNIADSKMIFDSIYGSKIDFLELKELRNKMLERALRLEGVPIKKGLVECLAFLKNKKKVLAIASSSSKQMILDNLNDTNLVSYFDLIVSGEDFKQSKPNPEIFLNVATHFDLKPNECLVIEDSKAGVEAALNAGMQIIWIPDLVRFEVSNKVIELNDLLEVIDVFRS